MFPQFLNLVFSIAQTDPAGKKGEAQEQGSVVSPLSQAIWKYSERVAGSEIANQQFSSINLLGRGNIESAGKVCK